MVSHPHEEPEIVENHMPFHMCLMFMSQLGLLNVESRPHIQLLKKYDQLIRELRNLDNQKCRETHKIAVIYVAQGQEDKVSILSNGAESSEFEDFVARLGWEVFVFHVKPSSIVIKPLFGVFPKFPGSQA